LRKDFRLLRGLRMNYEVVIGKSRSKTGDGKRGGGWGGEAMNVRDPPRLSVNGAKDFQSVTLVVASRVARR